MLTKCCTNTACCGLGVQRIPNKCSSGAYTGVHSDKLRPEWSEFLVGYFWL